MSATVILGLVFALVTSLAAVIAFLMKHRGVVAAPAVEIRRPVRTSLALFRSKWYLLGMLVAVGSWGFHVAALALAPISLVQSVIAGGLVFLTALADRLFGLRVTRREVIGVVLAAAGLAILAATLDGGADSAHDHYRTATLLAYVTVVIGVGVGAAIWARTMLVGGPLLGVATGCLWGASDICIKALAGGLAGDTLGTLTHPLVLVIAAASLMGVAISARSLQVGPPVPVIAMTTAAGIISTIVAGIVVFGEPFPGSAGGIVLRVLAFGLVVVAATLTPAPATPDTVER
jgi:drug/metabolite transporter (DMT)-like permease